MASKLYGVNATIIISVFVLYCIVLYCIEPRIVDYHNVMTRNKEDGNEDKTMTSKTE